MSRKASTISLFGFVMFFVQLIGAYLIADGVELIDEAFFGLFN